MVNKLKIILKECEEDHNNIMISDYGGWPRIWKKIISIGMASISPYWTPRPTIIVESGILGHEYIDWTRITDIKREPLPCPPSNLKVNL